MGMKMKRKQLWKPLLGLAMMGTAVVVLAVQSFAEQDTIPAITWVTTASGESAESEPQTEPLETEADSENANRQPVLTGTSLQKQKPLQNQQVLQLLQ